MLFACFEHSGNLIILASSKPHRYVDTSSLRLAEKGNISIRLFPSFSFFFLSFFLCDSSGIKLISSRSLRILIDIFDKFDLLPRSCYFLWRFLIRRNSVSSKRHSIIYSPFTIHNFSKFTLPLLPSNSPLNYTRRGRVRISMYI